MKELMSSLCAVGLLGLTGCATMNSAPYAVSIAPSSQVQISNVSVHMDNDTLHVTGNLRPSSASTTRTGHVDVDFADADGNVIQTVRAVPSASRFLRKSKRPASFSVKGKIEGVDAVKLTHHPDTMNECAL